MRPCSQVRTIKAKDRELRLGREGLEDSRAPNKSARGLAAESKREATAELENQIHPRAAGRGQGGPSAGGGEDGLLSALTTTTALRNFQLCAKHAAWSHVLRGVPGRVFVIPIFA